MTEQECNDILKSNGFRNDGRYKLHKQPYYFINDTLELHAAIGTIIKDNWAITIYGEDVKKGINCYSANTFGKTLKQIIINGKHES